MRASVQYPAVETQRVHEVELPRGLETNRSAQDARHSGLS
jgi:hypothetical protein